MKEYITTTRIASRVRMLRSDSAYSSRVFLFVEGNKDKTFYTHLIDGAMCHIEIAYGKENAIAVIKILEQDSFSGALAIVDADFDILEGKVPASQNIFFTDTHDLETMLLASPALEKVLAEYGSEEKIKGKDVRMILLEAGKPIGYLRWVSLRETMSLKFEGMKFDHFLDKTSITVDVSRLMDQFTHGVRTKEQIVHLLEKLQNDAHDPWHVCCGHDLIAILSEGLRSLLGSCKSQDVRPEVVERSLRLAYEKTFFILTKLYTSLRMWETHHSPFGVLAVL